MHYAYILRSNDHPDRYYHGNTSDLKKRIATHNAGGNFSTSPFRPWKLVWYGGFPSKQTGAGFERPQNHTTSVAAIGWLSISIATGE